MVALNTQTERDLANIDSLERLLIYSAQILRAVLVKPDNSELSNQLISFAFKNLSLEYSEVTITANIPYDSYRFNNYGGHILNAIQQLSSDIPPTIDFICAVSSRPSFLFPETPPSITTFEQQLVWTALILLSSPDPIAGEIKIIPYDSNPTNAYLGIIARFEIDAIKLLTGNNLIGAVKPYVEKYNLDFDPLISFSPIVSFTDYFFEPVAGDLTDEDILTDSTLITD